MYATIRKHRRIRGKKRLFLYRFSRSLRRGGSPWRKSAFPDWNTALSWRSGIWSFLSLSLYRQSCRGYLFPHEITRETNARFLAMYWPTLESSREVTRDEDIDSVEVIHPWWGFELVE